MVRSSGVAPRARRIDAGKISLRCEARTKDFGFAPGAQPP